MDDSNLANKNRSTNTEKPVWFITGCSTGLGRALAQYTLERGYRVVVTARDPSAVKDIAASGDALVLKLDVTAPGEVAAAIKAAEDKFGHIDVLVNNAGIGYFAAVEESEDIQIRRMFDINVFGLGHMTNAALPIMRKNRKGCIVNISSIAGLRSFPGVGYYNASKFAVVGLSGALRLEVEPLGIKVMVVEPSDFRTDWAGRSANESRIQIADYDPTAGKTRHHLREISGKQVGDPVRAAQAIVAAVESDAMPAHLLLGNDAYEGAMAALGELKKDFAAWEKVSRAADFPEAEL